MRAALAASRPQSAQPKSAGAGRSPAPHVAQALGAIQQRPSLAAGTGAPHVQAAIGSHSPAASARGNSVQARMDPRRPWPTSGVVQRAAAPTGESAAASLASGPSTAATASTATATAASGGSSSALVMAPTPTLSIAPAPVSAAAAVAAPLVVTGLTVTVRGAEGAGQDRGIKWKLDGRLSDGRAVDGGVLIVRYFVDTRSANPSPPVHEDFADAREQLLYDDAIRVHGITSSPEGLGLGNFLIARVAAHAIQSGVRYVIAMKAVEKAQPFYRRLGFRDFNQARPFAMLQALRKQNEERMDKVAPPGAKAAALSAEAVLELQRLGAQQRSLNSLLAETTLIVESRVLLQAAQAMWVRKWRVHGGAGNYQQILAGS